MGQLEATLFIGNTLKLAYSKRSLYYFFNQIKHGNVLELRHALIALFKGHCD